MLRLLSKYCFYYPVVLVKTKGFFRNVNKSINYESYSLEKLQEIQIKKIQNILTEAKNNVPYYKDVLQKIDPLSIKSSSDLVILPTLSKEILKKQHDRLLSSRRFFFITNKTTGGSTGQPVTIAKNRTAMGYELAATWRGYSWAGISIGDKQARFWGVPMSQKGRAAAALTDFICNRKRFSAFSFDHHALNRYVTELNSFKPDYLYGYVSMLSEFADYLLANNRSLSFSLKAIITTSEVLSDVVRAKLEEVLQTTVFNEYGCGEIGTIAHECSSGQLHLSADNMLVEIIDETGNQCTPGQLGEIVVTELNNTAMPLIRYRLGDLGMLSTEKCACGRGLPVLREVKGRAYDTVKLKNGKMFHGEFFMYIFEGAKRQGLGLSQFQVIQKERNDFLVKLVRPQVDGRLVLENYIADNMRTGMGAEVVVTFDYVDNISRTKSGKMQLIKALRD